MPGKDYYRYKDVMTEGAGFLMLPKAFLTSIGSQTPKAGILLAYLIEL